MKKILLFGPDKEQNQVFSDWIKGENYLIKSTDDLEQILFLLSKGKYNTLILDFDSPEIRENLLDLCRIMKKDRRFSELFIITLTYRKNTQLIASSIEAGVDDFIFKPFETESFLNRLDIIFKHIKLKCKGKKILDLNMIEYLINLAGEGTREDFFLLSSVIFNKLIIDRVAGIIGEPIILIMMKRLGDIIGENYRFMQEIRFENGKIFMDKVDQVSPEVPVKNLVMAFRNYFHGLLQMILSLSSNILMDRWLRK